MPGKRLAIWAVLMGTLALTGCCRWADRWCPERHAPVAAYPPPAAQACCVPATICCPPGTVPAGGAYPAGYQAAPAGGYQGAPPGGYQRNFSAAPGMQPTCCE